MTARRQIMEHLQMLQAQIKDITMAVYDAFEMLEKEAIQSQQVVMGATEARDGEHARVTTCDGKYTVIQMKDGSSHALRNGEPWQVYPEGGSVGNLSLALAHDLAEARKEIDRIHALNEREWRRQAFEL